MLTERYHWTQQQIEALDLDYYTELVAFIAAQSVVEHKHRTKAKRKTGD